MLAILLNCNGDDTIQVTFATLVPETHCHTTICQNALQGFNSEHQHICKYVTHHSCLKLSADGSPELTASLASLGPVAWVRLNEDEARFTIIPEQGTQVWA